MLLEELKRIISSGESEALEFKQSTGQCKEAAKSVCALLNCHGGFVIFGVTDKGAPIGQTVSNKTLAEIAVELRRIEPQAFPKISTVSVGLEKKCIVIHVLRDGEVYTYDGRPYLRRGSTTQVMPKETYERRLLECMHSQRRWENQFTPEEITLKDLDKTEIQNTLATAIQMGRITEPSKNSIEDILIGFKLIKEGKLINAALALFGRGERVFSDYPQFSIKLARFRGNDRLADFDDTRVYHGNIFELLRRGESFLFDHMPIAARVVPGKMVREDYPTYPPRAIREALANATCHRDYASFAGSVSMAMYNDHFEIINPGVFHFGISPEKLTHTHQSKPWNPTIADVLYKKGIIEQWGTGTINILEWCAENQNPAPKWEEQSESVVITFFPRTVFAAEKHIKSKERPGELKQLQINTQTLNDRVLELLRESPFSSAEIALKLGRKQRSGKLREVLKKLLINGSITYTIPEKPQSRLQKYRLLNPPAASGQSGGQSGGQSKP